MQLMNDYERVIMYISIVACMYFMYLLKKEIQQLKREIKNLEHKIDYETTAVESRLTSSIQVLEDTHGKEIRNLYGLYTDTEKQFTQEDCYRSRMENELNEKMKQLEHDINTNITAANNCMFTHLNEFETNMTIANKSEIAQLVTTLDKNDGIFMGYYLQKNTPLCPIIVHSCDTSLAVFNKHCLFVKKLKYLKNITNISISDLTNKVLILNECDIMPILSKLDNIMIELNHSLTTILDLKFVYDNDNWFIIPHVLTYVNDPRCTDFMEYRMGSKLVTRFKACFTLLYNELLDANIELSMPDTFRQFALNS